MADAAAPMGAHDGLISITPVITTDAYTSGDALGGLLTFANALRAKKQGKPSGYLVSATIIDTNNTPTDTPIELWLFSALITPTADNAPFDPSDADIAKRLGVIKFAASDYTDAANNSVATRTSINMGVAGGAAGQTSLFGQLVVRGTPTYDVGDISIGIFVAQN